MGLPSPVSQRRLSPVAVIATVAVVFSLFAFSQPAAADTAPPVATDPVTVSSDALAAPQINGVVWDQKVVGNTVYAAGNFTSARPAGSAPGVNEVARSYVLAYDVTTGALLPWAPTLNAQVRQLAVSPDGTRLYAVGDFTTVNGVAKSRIAAFDLPNGALNSAFTATANARIYAVAATASTVYIGGAFSSVKGVTRVGAAAVSASNGTPTAWSPTLTGGRAYAMVVSPDRSKVVIGGDFTSMNGSNNPGYGLGAVDSTTGASLPWAANTLVRNAGVNAAIFSLGSDADSVYGTGYVFGDGGNLEGTFRADWSDGTIDWVQDCHGDEYSVAVTGETVYIAGHPHYCGNVGGFPQTDPWTFHRALAFSKAATGTLTADPNGYYNFAGTPAPTQLNWFPDMNLGTFTGQYQGPWSVAANTNYVVYGGEFTTVNGKAQQGLVRFASKAIAPNLDGPRLTGDNLKPTLQSASPTTMTVSWPADWDRDNESLTYQVIRDGKTGTPVYTTTRNSRFWDLPTISWIDTGLTPGQTYSYRIRAIDPMGNSGWGSTVSATVATAGTLSDYAKAVIADQPTDFWRLGDSRGATANDSVGRYNATAGTGVTFGQPGAIIDDPDTAARFNGTNRGLVASSGQVWGDNTFSVETWVNTTSSSGGKIVGFGSQNTGNSGSYDRHVYMNAAGNLMFGVYPGSAKVVQSSKKYNDGQWHHIVASLGTDGMQLYVDGTRVGYNPDVTTAQAYWGYWRIGGDNSWDGNPYLTGRIDDTAVYPSVLTQQQILEHYSLSGRTATVPVAPTDAYGAAVYASDPVLYYRLGEASGRTAVDSGKQENPGSYAGSYNLGAAGAIRGTANTAARFDSGSVASDSSFNGPTTYSTEIWFNTTTTRGGKLTGFGSSNSGLSGSYDRHVYMQDDGTLVFGTWTGQPNTITTPSSYNDGAWHMVVATQSSAGMRLYIDGSLVGTNPQTSAQDYVGYWRAGGDTTWGSTDAYFAGTLDEFAVFQTALSPSTIAQQFALGAPEPPNAAPTAAFTSSIAGATATVDASGSSDGDGTIASYAWNFGDGSAVVTSSSATGSHTYSATGSYAVTLTVSDNDGATGSVSHDVQITQVNTPPTASFTSSTSDLAASFDGTASADPDGTITGYDWDFGDGSPHAIVASPSHTYAAAGDYTVSLTVTDNGGLTAATSKTVTVTAGSTLAEDHFERTTATGWGTAETGGPWTSSSTANSSVSAGTGVLSLTPGATRKITLNGVSATDADISTDLSFDKAMTGGGAFAGVIARQTASDYYQSRIRFLANGTLAVQIMQGGSTVLANATVPGTYTPGSALTLRTQITGTSPTTIRVKVWPTGTAEPAAWAVTATSSATGLQVAGSIGVVSYASTTITNTPLLAKYDNFSAQSAQ